MAVIHVCDGCSNPLGSTVPLRNHLGEGEYCGKCHGQNFRPLTDKQIFMSLGLAKCARDNDLVIVEFSELFINPAQNELIRVRKLGTYNGADALARSGKDFVRGLL